MAAITEIHSFHGAASPPPLSVAGLTYTIISASNCRYKRADNDAADFANLVQPPAGVENYSWRKHMRLFAKSDLVSSITNIRWFAGPEPLDWADQVALYVKAEVQYVQGSIADEFTQMSAAVNANERDTLTPLSFGTQYHIEKGDLTGGNGPYGVQSFVVTKMGVKPGCDSEVKSDRVCGFRYDET